MKNIVFSLFAASALVLVPACELVRITTERQISVSQEGSPAPYTKKYGFRWDTNIISWTYEEGAEPGEFRDRETRHVLSYIESVTNVTFVEVEREAMITYSYPILPADRHAQAYPPSDRNPRSGDVEINSASFTKDLFARICCHETLHALGLPHVDDYRSIMNEAVAYLGYGIELTPGDIAEVNKRYTIN
tara:strand:+ start:152 stop:721 length:570 start_codon:yes stop_codon:yes gene_type:complete